MLIVLALLQVNIFALVMALRVTARATKGRSTKAPPQASTWIRGSASLVAILGTTWLFGFLYFSNGEFGYCLPVKGLSVVVSLRSGNISCTGR